LQQQESNTSRSSIIKDSIHLEILKVSTIPVSDATWFHSSEAVVMLRPYREDIFCAQILHDLELFYEMIYPFSTFQHILPFYVQCGRVTLCNQLIGSVLNSRCSNSSAIICAHWPETVNDVQTNDYNIKPRIGRVEYFCKHRIIASMPGKQQQEYEHILAYVKWYQSHPNSDFYGSSAIVCKNTHKEGSSCSFIPVQRIHAVCAYCELDIEIANVLEDVLIAIPLPAKFG